MAISRREKHIRRHRHDKGLGFNAAHRSPQVAGGMAADVAALPFPRHAQQIVRIHYAEIAVHEVDDKIVDRRKAQRLVAIFLEKRRAPAHHRPQFGVAQQTLSHVRRRCIETFVEPRVRGDRLDQGFGEKKIMDGILGGAGDRRRALRPYQDSVRPIRRSAEHPLSRRPLALSFSGRTFP